MSREELLQLIESEKVVGRGTGSKLRYVQLTVPRAEIADALAAKASERRRTRGLTPLDFLMRMVRDRNTIYREHLMTTDQVTGLQVKSGAWVFQHKAYGTTVP